MTTSPHIIFIALEDNAQNAEFLQRIGYVTFTQGLKDAERVAILTGNQTYDRESPECSCFLTPLSADGGRTMTHLFGSGQFSESEVDHLSLAIGQTVALGGVFVRLDATTWKLTEDHNADALRQFEGQPLTIEDIKNALGFTGKTT